MDDLEKRSSSDLQSESWSTTTVYDAVCEKDNAEFETVNAVQGVNKVEEIENAIQEEVYEEYDGDFQKYTPRYATYSRPKIRDSHSIMQKILAKKNSVILVILVVCTIGVAIGLSVHFTGPPTTTMTSTTTVSSTTTVPLIETDSIRGM